MEEINKNDYLIIARKQVALIIAGIILLAVFIFMAGYFWGYRRLSQDIQLNIKQASFADEITYATNHSEPVASEISAIAQAESVKNTHNDIIVPVDNNILIEGQVAAVDADLVGNENQTTTDNYYAELIGFGRIKAAQAFVAKLQKKGFEVTFKQRASKTSQGKIVNWYQVVTPNYTDKQALQKIVNAISRTEHLQGIKIKKV